MATIQCKKCGKRILASATECPYCGEINDHQEQKPKPKPIIPIQIPKLNEKEMNKGKIIGNVICEDCGTIGTAGTKVAGAFWAELLLYIIGIALAVPTFFISLLVPIGYSIHRHIAATKVCKICGGKVVNIHSPRGEILVKQMGYDEK